MELLANRLSPAKESSSSLLTLQLLQQIAQQQHATLVEYSIIYDEFKINGKQKTHEPELYIWTISPTGNVAFRSVDPPENLSSC